MRKIFIFVVACLIAEAGAAEPKPVLEIGVGAGGQWLNDYRGSKESQFTALPFPFFIYRGNVFKVDDEDGARGEFLSREKFEINLSADVALRSDSEGNKLREGMPELDTAFELGPELDINLTGENLKKGWMLRLPLRAAFTLGSGEVNDIGYTFSPKLTYKKPDFIWGWRLKTDMGLMYGTQSFHEYYYSVADEYVTSGRSLFDADSGYSGAFARLGMYKRKGNWIYRATVRYDNLEDAVFIDSPLVETKDYYSVSFGLGWIFYARDE